MERLEALHAQCKQIVASLTAAEVSVTKLRSARTGMRDHIHGAGGADSWGRSTLQHLDQAVIAAEAAVEGLKASLETNKKDYAAAISSLDPLAGSTIGAGDGGAQTGAEEKEEEEEGDNDDEHSIDSMDTEPRNDDGVDEAGEEQQQQGLQQEQQETGERGGGEEGTQAPRDEGTDERRGEEEEDEDVWDVDEVAEQQQQLQESDGEGEDAGEKEDESEKDDDDEESNNGDDDMAASEVTAAPQVTPRGKRRRGPPATPPTRRSLRARPNVASVQEAGWQLMRLELEKLEILTAELASSQQCPPYADLCEVLHDCSLVLCNPFELDFLEVADMSGVRFKLKKIDGDDKALHGHIVDVDAGCISKKPRRLAIQEILRRYAKSEVMEMMTREEFKDFLERQEIDDESGRDDKGRKTKRRKLLTRREVSCS